MASSVVFINTRGDILIYRAFRDDVSRKETRQFCNQIVAKKEARDTPIICINGVSYLHTTNGDINLVATCRNNCNAAMIVQFLYSLVNLCKAYFGGEFDQNQIRKNYVLIYELLDEIMDYGYPQILDPDLLKTYITQGKGIANLNTMQKLKQFTIQATGAVSWRGPDIFYKKNEVYIDVVESVNVLFSQRGTVLRQEVVGQVVMKALLTGWPECKLGINDKLVLLRSTAKQVFLLLSGSFVAFHMLYEKKKKILIIENISRPDRGINIEDIKFHQCVRLGRFDKDRSITFVPPDGTFELMTYRINENVILPFQIMPIIQEHPTSVEVNIKMKAIFERTSFATTVVIKVPLPKNTSNVTAYSGSGKARYEPEHGAIMWRIKKFTGDSELVLTAEAKLSSTKDPKPWTRPPISAEFQVPMFTASGLRERTGYVPTKWIRYITKAGEYQHRI